MIMDPELFGRFKHKEHKGVAALPLQAVKDGHFPGWEPAEGPLPEGPKSAVVFPKLVDLQEETEPEQEAPAEPKSADKPSAKK